MADVKTLSVNLYGSPVGTLTLLSGDRSIFAFNDDYISDPARPTLSLSFKDEFGGLITQSRPTQTSLTPFFSNLLPEGHMRDYLAVRAGVKKMREFHLLWALGADLPGALTVTSNNDTAWHKDDAAGDDAEDGGTAKAGAMRFSLAGVQMKFSAIAEAHGGLTIPVDGAGGSWIVKLPSTRFERVPENEYSMMSLAEKIGIDVPNHNLLDPSELRGLPEGVDALTEPAFVIERFDRGPDGARIHIEDFAQVFGVYPGDKYEKGTYRAIARVLWIETGATGVEEFIRRLVFNTLIGNADMHLKNWSLIYPDRRTPALAPAYDFVSTIAYLKDEFAALKYARQKRMLALSFDELAYLAAKAGAPETLVVGTARDTVERFDAAWTAERNNLPITNKAKRAINAHYESTELFRAS